MKLSETARWLIFGVIAAAVLISAWLSRDPNKVIKQAAEQAAIQAAEDQREKMLQDRRESGFVEKVDYTNAFGDVTTRTVSVLGRTKGTMLTIRREGTGKLVDVCFSAITNDKKRELFAPYFSTTVYAKFDGGETKEFSASRGSTEDYLCISSPQKFLFEMSRANRMRVELIFLDHYSKVPEVHEWNLKQYNEMIKR
ncbi:MULTISPECIES: hypothetical protein [Enterobacter cloacae complex]|uniref:hypothetical protein n=1 Tax=Enterobacter cloacae complex TaxID=354276 RepID=UPI0005ED50AA|nr:MULTISPECIES: hypothetical protein [Enterobacter cloacae complex]AKL03501.1 hypothetical protein AB190_24260 [Enterobacter asburiae]KJO38187.1 hypothetical protein SS06_00020 [Enterobacter roggenkampii]MCM7151963.1 hypothetical protein [Enterobacter kobei]MCU3441648.1 hypothetical protein [Enterobacter asburiae]QCC91447.1 hypothetical protein E7735_11085 [Enterobacter cloacae]